MEIYRLNLLACVKKIAVTQTYKLHLLPMEYIWIGIVVGLCSLFPTDQTRGGSYRKLSVAVHLEPVRANQVLKHVYALQICAETCLIVTDLC